MAVLRRILACALIVLAGSGCSSDEPTAPEPARTYDLAALTLTPQNESSPALSPDGRRVAFVRSGAIVVKDRATRVETIVAAHGDAPCWAPDGASLYYVRRDTGPLIHRLVHRDLAGGPETVVSPDSVDVYEPAISPAGNAVVYRALSRITLLQSLRVLMLDGSFEFVVSPPGPWTDGSPNWTQSRGIAFTRLFPGGASQIWRVAADEGATPLLFTAATNATDPAWSADGDRLAFSQQGSLVTIASGGDSPSTLVPAPGLALAPDYGRDGRTLTYVSNRFGNFDVFVLEAQDALGAGPYTP